MTDVCKLVGKPFDRADWLAAAPSEPYFTPSDDGKTGHYDWVAHGLIVRTRFDGAMEKTDEVELHATDLLGGRPWGEPFPYGLNPKMDRAAVENLLGTPAETFENPDEQLSPYPYPYLSYHMGGGVRLTVSFRLGRMYGVNLR
ncbi:MAG: hypothetical protein AAF334_10420 [Pseudomonadota bacterium]